MNRYVIWNPDKLAMDKPENYHNEHPLSTYKGLLEIEKVTGYSYSSEVSTADIQELQSAVAFETDVMLCYHKLT